MRRWVLRVGALVLIVVLGEVLLTLIDSRPSLLEWTLSASAAVVLVWLASDVAGVADARWDDPLAPYARPDAAEDSVHHRVLTNHLAAREPGPALRRLLLDLGGPDGSDRPHLPDGPLTPADVDRYLTRIEEPRARQ